MAYENGVETGRFDLKTAAGAMRLSAKAECEHMDAVEGLAFIDIALVDEQENVFVKESRRVKVSVTGAGQLEGFGTADPDSEENFFDEERTTFDGRALAVIRPTEAGEIIVTVSTDGLESKTIRLISE